LDSEQNHKPRDKSNRVRVFVGSIPASFDDEELQTLFSGAGEVVSASIRETDTTGGLKRWA